jgi:hypothetical protein
MASTSQTPPEYLLALILLALLAVAGFIYLS